MMRKAKEWYQKQNIKNTIAALRNSGFEAISKSTKEDAVTEILDNVPMDASVGLGGSVTLRELNLPQKLKNRGNEVSDHWQAGDNGATNEEIIGLKRKQLTSDVFITSTNAVTKTGELVNIDGDGQRVAAMIFGPEKVIVTAGLNKIVDDVDEGIKRARNIAAPMNAKRLNMKTPCVESGKCVDCNSDKRICNVTTVMHRKPAPTDIRVIIVEEILGY